MLSKLRYRPFLVIGTTINQHPREGVKFNKKGGKSMKWYKASGGSFIFLSKTKNRETKKKEAGIRYAEKTPFRRSHRGLKRGSIADEEKKKK